MRHEEKCHDWIKILNEDKFKDVMEKHLSGERRKVFLKDVEERTKMLQRRVELFQFPQFMQCLKRLLSENIPEGDSRWYLQTMLKYVVKEFTIHPFVFPFGTLGDEDTALVIENNPDVELDLPFPVVHFELKNETLVNLYPEKFPGSPRIIMSALIFEFSPKDYLVFTQELDPVFKTTYIANRSEERAGILPLLKNLLDYMKSSRLYTEESDYRIKYRDKKTKQKHSVRINQIIHVSKSKTKPTTALGGSIDYSHRFEVMGHWRKVKGIGKDRAGEYVVNGYTWVKNHEKGDKSLPLVKKTRIVDE